MRITELTGFRGHPAYQAVRQLRTQRDPEDSYDLDLKKSDQATAVTQELKRLGWRPTAYQGTMSLVYQHPDRPYVLKLFRDAPGIYRQWLRYVADNQQNPHVPRLYGRPRRINAEISSVRMEILQAIKDSTIQRYVDPSLHDSLPSYGYTLIFHQDNDRYLREHFPLLAQAADFAFSIGDDLLESENIMQRGSTLVLIDP